MVFQCCTRSGLLAMLAASFWMLTGGYRAVLQAAARIRTPGVAVAGVGETDNAPVDPAWAYVGRHF